MIVEKKVYIKFFAPVNNESSNILMNVIDSKLREGFEKAVILISTPGGSVFHGISIYNFLKGIPMEIETHNFGSVDSIGTVIYAAGNKRYSVPNARFLFHPVSMSFQNNSSFEEKKIEELLSSIRIDESNIAAVIAKETNKNKDDIIDLILTRTTLNPDEGVDIGLVHELRPNLIEKGYELISINMS
jgi:ATP-dependent Clp protease protease subunit